MLPPGILLLILVYGSMDNTFLVGDRFGSWAILRYDVIKKQIKSQKVIFSKSMKTGQVTPQMKGNEAYITNSSLLEYIDIIMTS